MLRPGDRLLVLAPHPDDESLGTGGALQVAAGAGIPVRVVFVTSGERNPWAQRATERRFWLDKHSRLRFANLRRRESAAALADLGQSPDIARFLELPDQGLTDLLLHHPEELTSPLAVQVQSFLPTVVIGPSYWDLHPDHSALAVALDVALQGMPPPARPRELWHYLIHHPGLRSSDLPGATLSLGEDQRERKHRAILSHRSQHIWRGHWLRSFAAAEERLIGARTDPTELPTWVASQNDRNLAIGLAMHPRLWAFGRRTLYLLAAGPAGAVRTVSCPLPIWSGRLRGVALSPPSEETLPARFRGGPRRGVVEIPADWAPPGHALYAKVSRRFGFFDEAGWTPLIRF